MNSTNALYHQILKQLLPISLLFILGILWGSGYSIARFATTHAVSPLGYAFWQSLGPALFTLFFCWLANFKIPISKSNCKFYFVCGLIGIAIPNSNMYLCSAKLPASLLAILVNTVPLITYLLTLSLGHERFSLLRFLGILLGFIGILCLILPKTSLPSVSLVPWILLALITPICFASCAIYAARQKGNQGNVVTQAAGMLIASSLLLLPVVLALKSFYLPTLPFTTADWIILLEIVLSSIGYILFFQLLKMAGPVYYSLVGGIVMLAGIFWGWLIFAETLNVWTSVTTLLILTGIYLVTLGQINQLPSSQK